MNRRLELWLVVGLLLLAALLRLWNLVELPPGFSDDELAYIHITESVRSGDVAVYYVAPNGTGRAALYGVANAFITSLAGDGLLGYRLLPAFAGLVTLALLYALARRLFSAPVALIALAIATVNLRLILLARTGTAAAVVPLLVVLVLYVLALAFNLRREIRFHTPGTPVFALLALLLGMGAYLHYSALLLGPLAVLFVAHLLFTRQPISRRVWSAAVFVFVLATIIGGPYVLSTLQDAAQSEPSVYWDARPGSVRQLVDGALHAVGAIFWRGDPSLTHNAAEAPLLGPILGLLLLGGLVETTRHWRDPRYALLGLALLFGLLLDTWIGVEATFTANLILLPAIMILPGVGAKALADGLRTRGGRAVWQPVSLVVITVVAINGLVMRDRLFDDWQHDAAVRRAYSAHMAGVAAYLDHHPEGPPVSLCTARLDSPGEESGLTPRETLAAMRHREGLAIRHSDCRGGIVLIDAGAPMRFIFARATDRAALPPELREWFSDAEPIPVEGLPNGSVVHLDVQQRLRDAGGQWDALSPVYFMPDDESDGERVDLPVPLGQNLTFAGYDPRALREPYRAGGGPIVLVTYWRVDGELPDDLGFFAHLLAYPNGGDDGRARIPLLEPWAESNSIDVVPEELRRRDFVVHVSYLWLAKNLRPAAYALTVGAYTDSVSVLANHLPVLDPVRDYQPHGDRLFLGNIEIQSPASADGAEPAPAEGSDQGGS